MTPDDESRLIRRIVNGETALFALLAERYGGAVYSLVVRIAGCPEDAEELAQDAFLKAYRHLSRFDGRSSFATWLYRIACNTALSHVRSRKRAWRNVGENRLANFAGDASAPFDDADGKQALLEALTAAVARLEPEERALVTLFYYESVPVAECAKIMELTEANVKVRLHRIRKKLYATLNDRMHGNE